MERVASPFLDEFVDFTVRVFEVPEVNREGGTDNHAGRAGLTVDAGRQPLLQPGVYPFLAEDALLNDAHLVGVEICKIFPAGQVGGPAFIKSVKAPCPWAELMPTGGVSPTRENLTEWFSAGAVCVGMGSKLITKDLIKAGDFEGLTAQVKECLALIAEIRKAC